MGSARGPIGWDRAPALLAGGAGSARPPVWRPANPWPPAPHTAPPADLASKLRAGEEAAVKEARILTQQARQVEAKLEEEAKQAGRMLKRMEMEAGMGPWVK